MTKPAIHHGSPYDRGAADSWYMRPPQPHYYVLEKRVKQSHLFPDEVTYGLRRIEEDEMLKEEVEAYLMGYRENEEANLHKDYR